MPRPAKPLTPITSKKLALRLSRELGRFIMYSGGNGNMPAKPHDTLLKAAHVLQAYGLGRKLFDTPHGLELRAKR